MVTGILEVCIIIELQTHIFSVFAHGCLPSERTSENYPFLSVVTVAVGCGSASKQETWLLDFTFLLGAGSVEVITGLVC